MRNKIQLIIITATLLTSINAIAQLPELGKSSWDSITKEQDDKIRSYKGKEYEYAELLSERFAIPRETLQKKIIFLHSWFASCAPCIREFKGLNEMYERLKGDTNFQFISLTFENDQTIKEFRKKYNLKYKIVHVSFDECYKLNLIGGFPTNVVLNRNMIVDQIFSGGKITEDETGVFINTEIFSEIKKLLDNYKQ